jgi:hypothetical protein
MGPGSVADPGRELGSGDVGSQDDEPFVVHLGPDMEHGALRPDVGHLFRPLQRVLADAKRVAKAVGRAARVFAELGYGSFDVGSSL